eukprot:scaffold1805_cov104-Cylindrotheca_fusiformis.AAC.12
MSFKSFLVTCCGFEEEETKLGGLFFESEDSDEMNDDNGKHDWVKRSSFSSLNSIHHRHAKEKAQVALELKRGKEVLSKDTILVKQGDDDQNLQIIQRGKVNVYCERETSTSVGTLKRGDIFGEMALLYGENSPHSLIVVEDGTIVWRLDHYTFRRILAHSAHQRDGTIKSSLMRNIPMFQSFSEPTLQKFADSLTRVTHYKGERIVTKGDEGTVFYLIESGQVKVHDIGMGDGRAVDQYLSAGDCFGERALLTGQPRVANVTVHSHRVTLLAMDRDDFLQKYMGELETIMNFDAKLRTLKSLPIFANSNLTAMEFRALAEQTIEVCYPKETKLVEAGKTNNERNLWMIRSGRLLVYGGKSGKVYNLQSGNCFGERDLLRDYSEVLNHDAICEDNVTAFVLSRKAIESVVVDLKRLGRDEKFVQQKKSSSSKRGSQSVRRLDDLKKHRILGEGSFGKVWLVEHVMTHTPYALKVIHKRKVLMNQQQRNVMRERELLSLLHHPFILDMVTSFQDVSNLYMLLPVIQGGELFSRIVNGGGLPSKDAAFYAGCIVEALGHFHHRYIAYRDLKPENVMIDEKGYAKIVDLGFAKVVMGKTYTFCGTPEYLAPEIIMSKGHNHAVDYWSLGVVLFVLLTGITPFYKANDSSQMDMFERIVLVRYQIPPQLDDPLATNLIQQLLVRNVPDRLGNLSGGHFDIRDHCWFVENDVHYKQLLAKTVDAPPWIPELKDPLDSSNFDDYNNYDKPLSSTDDHDAYPSLSREEQSIFEGF